MVNNTMFVKMAQADAYAMATEYLIREKHFEQFEGALTFSKYISHPFVNLLPGQYSDDTQMSIAIAEVMLSKQIEDISSLDFANSFVSAFKRDERPGYSKKLQEILESVADGAELIKILNTSSNKNGAAMRAIPLGFLSDKTEVIRLATMQAKITHDTEAGILSAIAIALMAHFAIHYSESFLDMRKIIPDWHPVFNHLNHSNWNDRVLESPIVNDFSDTVAKKTVHAVYTLLTTKHNLKEILEQIIEWGGDTDSVAALAWGIGSYRMTWPGIEPAFFKNDLEKNGQYGYDYLLDLNVRMNNNFISSQ